MQRICRSLASDGFAVYLIGRSLKNSPKLSQETFYQNRIFCWFTKGPFFYIEYNLKLFIYLLFKRLDALCAIDLDTILPVLFISIIRGKLRVYDAHEYFTEQKEVYERQTIFRIWSVIEKRSVPKYRLGYTVNQHLADLYYQKYQVNYQIIRNISVNYPLENIDNESINKFILYQGAVNHGRCFEQLIPAMKMVDIPLVIAGEGNFLEETKEMVRRYDLANKVEFKGRLAPLELRKLTQKAYIGLTLFEAKGANQYYSLANRFFDYMMAGIPQVCINYPEYAQINDQYQFAFLIPDTKPETIAQAINNLLTDDVLYQQLRFNCLKARSILNWQNEEHKLINFYRKLTRE
ncbi:MAG: glycosyltransferase [Sediminibacterium sp.]|nr:glycosyltransferase [Sediminibacterium sp.]MBX9778751.1 glycosyltransferase [Chitinophagaceae bacterium]